MEQTVLSDCVTTCRTPRPGKNALLFGRNVIRRWGISTRGSIEYHLIELVSRSGMPPGAIEHEILEFKMIKEEHGVPWKSLVAHGFNFSIDDFGIGESSLARLKSLPFSTLNIDRSYVMDYREE